MYRGEIINPQLLRILGETGHTDTICVSDAGLPVPDGVERVDLAWKKGEPDWLDVCKSINKCMTIEKVYLAEEIAEQNADMYNKFIACFKNVKVEFIPHARLKKDTANCKAVIRTGEYSSYCNCIFVAGVNF